MRLIWPRAHERNCAHSWNARSLYHSSVSNGTQDALIRGTIRYPRSLAICSSGGIHMAMCESPQSTIVRGALRSPIGQIRWVDSQNLAAAHVPGGKDLSW